MAKRMIILGSTGSIGRDALEVARALGDEVEIVGVAAGANWRLLAQQVREFRAPCVALSDGNGGDDLRRECPAGVKVWSGPDAAVDLVRHTDADLVLSAIVGAAGLPATLAAVERGMDVALANKESLVVAGALLIPLAKQSGSSLIPVDSEHSAVFQAMQSGRAEEVSRIYITASGGPFRTWSPERIAEATLDEALNHPTWDMGPKITIDSATMMNKALEIIEAVWLFGVPPEKVEVLVHPESIVHALVEFCDGSVIAQLGAPDMKTPIQYAITYPRRLPGPSRRLDWREVRSLNFEPADPRRFPALTLGYDAAKRGGSAGAALNAANEAAVELFRAGRIRFGQISELTEQVYRRHEYVEQPTLDDLMACDAWARQEVRACCRC